MMFQLLASVFDKEIIFYRKESNTFIFLTAHLGY